MSNKLKTLSESQLETLISKAVGEYLVEDVTCSVSNLDIPHFDTEKNVGLDNKRTLTFETKLSYEESDNV